MSAAAGVAKSKSVKESLTCDRICDEHAREAKIIQSSLLPTTMLCHESVEIAFRFIPFADVGGDFADFFFLPDGCIGIYLGDVVGKGLPAAMFAALVMGTLRGIHKTGTDTALVLERLNERMAQRPICGRFCSTLYALFNVATRELIFSNAGMPHPLLISGTTCRQLGEGGLPSGMFAAPLTSGTSCNCPPETAFCSHPTVFTNCAIGRRLSSAPLKWTRCGLNVAANRQPNRRTLFSTGSSPSPTASRRTTTLLGSC